MDLPLSDEYADADEHLKTVDKSSLFDLRAELYRKRAKAEQIAASRNRSSTTREKNPLLISKEEARINAEKKKEREVRIKKLEDAMNLEEEKLEEIKRILAEKSEIYNRLSNGEIVMNEDDQPVEFLVDFSARQREEEKEKIKKAELAELEITEAVHFIPDEDQRVLGPSHYIFSKIESERQKELEELLSMTEKTDLDRMKRKEFIKKREIAKLERLNKVRKRKGLEEIKLVPDAETSTAVPYLDIPLPESKEIMPEKRKRVKVREWDRGKKAYWKWMNSRRDERNAEFMPPSSY